MDIRAQLLTQWLTDSLKINISHLQIASSDASFRRYFRMTHNSNSLIAMDAPPDKENLDGFLKVQHILQQSGANVPEIYACNLEQGFLLLEDFGSQCFLDRLNLQNADNLYQTAIDALFKFQNQNPDNLNIPEYNAALLMRELDIFYDWFLERRLGVVIPDTIKTAVNDILIDSALSQPRVFVHRDYHSRNLMWQELDSPGIIDFQDAVIGPITYDLVSLLKDCYIDWPEELVQKWLHTYYCQLTRQRILQISFDKFERWFDLMGMQRHLKAIGIFSRLDLRDHKPGYLNDIPRTLQYIQNVVNKYPELGFFNECLPHPTVWAATA